MMGGISHEELARHPDPAAAVAEYHHGLEQTSGRRWLVAPGCSIPPTTPAGTLRTIRAEVEGTQLTSERSP